MGPAADGHTDLAPSHAIVLKPMQLVAQFVRLPPALDAQSPAEAVDGLPHALHVYLYRSLSENVSSPIEGCADRACPAHANA